MKNISTVIILSVLAFSVSAQKVITTINTGNRVEGYNFKYDNKSGSFVYNDYDTTAKKNVIITQKGKSRQYDYSVQYSALFDADGNVYNYAYNLVTDTVYKYFLLKNGDEIDSYDYIGEGWDINNNVIYFLAKEGGKAYIASYNTKTGEVNGGKKYDDIYLVNFPDQYYDEEPVGNIGFTKDGKPFYLAVEGDNKFLVIGDTEQKHYSDIDWYMTKTDLNGELTYVAKSKGNFYTENGNTFLVQGSKEYKSFDYIFGPVLFDKNNNPVYVSSDSIGDYKYRSRMMLGSKESKSYNGNIYEYKFTPSGKLAYVLTRDKKINGGDSYENILVIDGEEGKPYQSISNLTFTYGDVPVFTASNKNNKYFVVKDDKVISEKYDNIYDYRFFKDGSLSYIGNNFGDYEKQVPDKNYIYILGKKFGPYEFISMADYTAGKYILTDENDNYVFVSGKLIDRTNYYYKYKVTTNKWESPEYDFIDMVKMSNGKVIYVSGNYTDRTNYIYKYSLCINNMPVAEDYESISELIIDKNSGMISCIGCKNNSFYLLEF
ncbi:MAG TPA: hypothetical protein VGK25_11815 [Ignavibacteria bacterium]|jgi:hypothetical protein